MRKLTGKWYLKKRLFGYSVIVEVNVGYLADGTSDKGGYEYRIRTEYQKASSLDLVELGIIIT